MQPRQGWCRRHKCSSTDDGHATHWVWHFCMQVHCKQKLGLAEMSKSNAASPGLVPETGADHARVFTHCKPVVAGVCTRCGKSCRQVTLCRHWLQVSYVLQAEAAGKTHGAVAACGCRSASHCCGCCTRCRPSRGWRTRCGHGLRVAYQAVGSTHWAAIGCGCLATRCGQGCGYFTLCRQRFAGETHVAAMVAGASRGALVRAISHRGARGKVKAVRTVKLTLPAEPRGWSLH